MTTQEQLAKTVVRAQGGSQEAFAVLVRRFYRPVYGVAYSQVGEWDAAEDLVQETFLLAWHHRKKLRNPELFPAWLMQIARNLSKNWIRSTVFRRELSQRYGAVMAKASSTPTPQARSDVLDDRKDALSQALEKLSPTLREAVLLFYMEQKSIEETALSLGISVSAAKKRTQRGRDALRASMESAWERELEERARTIRSEERAQRVMGLLALPPVSAGAGQVAAIQALPTVSDIGHGLLQASTVKIGATALAALFALGVWMILPSRDAAEPAVANEAAEGAGTVLALDQAPTSGFGLGEPGEPDQASVADADRGNDGSDDSALRVANLRDVGVDPDTPATPPLPDGEATEDKALGAITGRVVDESGIPLAGAQVILFPFGLLAGTPPGGALEHELGLDAPRTTRTDSAGAFEFRRLHAGAYRIAAAMRGYQDSPHRSFGLSSDEVYDGVELKLESGEVAVVHARVVDAQGRPVTNAFLESIVLMRTDGGSRGGGMAIGVTDENGVAMLDVPGAGSVALTVQSAELGATVFRGVPTDTVEPVTLKWPEGGTLEGVIRGAGAGARILVHGDVEMNQYDEEGNPAGGASSNASLYAADVGANGEYRIMGLAPDMPLRLEIKGNGQTLMPERPIPPFESGEVRRFDYTLAEETVIRGRIAGATSGAPLEDVWVHWRSVAEPLVTDSQAVGNGGTFEFAVRLPAGRYLFCGDFYPPQRDEMYMRTYGKVVQIVPGEDMDIALTFLDPVRRTVRVVDPTGAPIAGAGLSYRVHHDGGSSSWGFGLQTDANGTATYAGVAPYEEVSFTIAAAGYGHGETGVIVGEPGDVYEPEVVVLEPRAESMENGRS